MTVPEGSTSLCMARYPVYHNHRLRRPKRSGRLMTGPKYDWYHMTPKHKRKGHLRSSSIGKKVIYVHISIKVKTGQSSTCPMWHPSSAVTLSGTILFEVDLWPKRPESPLPKVKSFPSDVTTAECLNPHASWEGKSLFKWKLIMWLFWWLLWTVICLYLHNLLSLQSLDLFGSPLAFAVPVAEFPIIPITPAEHLSSLGESQWVSIWPIWGH